MKVISKQNQNITDRKYKSEKKIRQINESAQNLNIFYVLVQCTLVFDNNIKNTQQKNLFIIFKRNKKTIFKLHFSSQSTSLLTLSSRFCNILY